MEIYIEWNEKEQLIISKLFFFVSRLFFTNSSLSQTVRLVSWFYSKMRRFSATANESHSDRQFQQSDETQLNNPIFIGDNGIALETISSNTSDDSSRSGYSTQELSHLMTSTNPPKK